MHSLIMALSTDVANSAVKLGQREAFRGVISICVSSCAMVGRYLNA